MAKKIIVPFFAVFFIVPVIWAGGWSNALMGIRAMGLGAAFVGVADDPSAIFYNPAGLAFQKQSFSLTVDGFYIRPTHEYVMFNGRKAESKFNTSVPQLFFSYRMNERITLGFGFYVPYAGGGIDWKKEELGIPFKSTLGVYTLTPTIAYQVSEQLSIGFKLNIYRGVMDVNAGMLPSGLTKIEESGSALSAGFGIMYRPTEKIGVGLSIRGPARLTLSGETTMPLTIPGLGTSDVDFESETSFNLPWDFEAGFSYRISERFLFSTSAQYTMWSRLDKIEKIIKDIPFVGDQKTTEDMNFKDILLLRAGVEYVFPQGVFLRGGLGIDRYATPEETLNFRNIDVDKFSILGGIGYRMGKMQVDFVYIYARGKEREKELMYYGSPFVERYNLNTAIFGLGVTFSL